MTDYHADMNSLLSQLLSFAAAVAVDIRMNSVYNDAVKMAISSNDPSKIENILTNVMWLSDALHNLDILGDAIAESDYNKIIIAADMHIQIFLGYMGTKAFDKSEELLHLSAVPLDYGIDLFKRIKECAMAQNEIDQHAHRED